MKLTLISLAFLIGTMAFAETGAGSGLVINAEELGVGKFHVYDNMIHAYAKESAWSNFVPAMNVDLSRTSVVKNDDGSFTIYFSSLEMLLKSLAEITQRTGAKIRVLNLHGHGLPGGMWFPATEAELVTDECTAWRDTAYSDAKVSYDQYYALISKQEIMGIRSVAETPTEYGCTTGLRAWQNALTGAPGIKSIFVDDAVIRFVSCVVGLGRAGEEFTQGIAKLLLPSDHGRVETSVNFGLGDWSMNEGMGFWDYQNDDQLARDNQFYASHHTDREIRQKGTIRVAQLNGDQALTSILADQDFMPLGVTENLGLVLFTSQPEEEMPILPLLHVPAAEPPTRVQGPAPELIRIPGTTAYVHRTSGSASSEKR